MFHSKLTAQFAVKYFSPRYISLALFSAHRALSRRKNDASEIVYRLGTDNQMEGKREEGGRGSCKKTSSAQHRECKSAALLKLDCEKEQLRDTTQLGHEI